MKNSPSKQEAYDKIAGLVEHFASQIEVFKKSQNETETRNQFINPLFEALGWDIDNTKRKAIDSDRDVVHEDRLKIEGKSKAPDYSFRIGGKRKFFLEAKKPSVKIETDIIPSYQLRRYGWNDPEVHISILTDFEEFAVYDCTIQPKQTDTADFARHKYITYNQYLEKFDWLWDLFSKEQVVKGSLDQFAKSIKKGTQGVDTAFLKSLDEWRNYLATSIALRNKHLNEDDINYLVQMNINRIVFIRNCEDRGAEPYGKLKGCLVNSNDEGGYFHNMYQVFEDADRKYNSGLFDFTKDTVSKSVIIDNEVIKNIVDELYFPKSPYEFSVIGVEILGTAYERFLGKVIRLTPDHQAIVEEKPEVRKAGGVFYTPQYVVEYIVKQTVGKLIKGKTPDEIAKIKICDPSCGSGSFLLGAYQYLLVYHTDWYIKNYKKNRNLKDSPLTPDGRLTTHVKKQILLNNIFGVDIDTQAVEVTKLSLLMKCMEGETTASMQTTMTFERVLPTLENNIKSGNSLIDFDFYEGQLDFGDEKKIKPFNWKSAFPQVFNQGGFDAIIGNPPYDVLEKDRLGESAPHLALQKYIQFNNSFTSALGGKLNLYRFFIVKSIQLTKSAGRFGFIVPMSILGDKSCSNTREFLLSSIAELEFDCFPQKDNPTKRIFKEAKLSTTVFCGEKDALSNRKESDFTIRTYPANSFNDEHKKCSIRFSDLKAIDPDNLPIPLIDEANYVVLKKIHTTKGIARLGTVKDFVVRRGEINQTIYKEFIEEEIAVNERLIKGVQIGQYRFNKKVSQGKVEWFNEEKFLQKNSKREVATLERIATQRITGVDERLRIVASLIQPKAYFADSTNSIHVKEGTKYDLKYLLGLLNSKLFQWRFKLTSTNNNVGTNELEAMPFKEIYFPEQKMHDDVVKNVENLLKFNADIQNASDPSTIDQLQGRIAHSTQRIDEIVYQLYELTPEEIAIVESQS